MKFDSQDTISQLEVIRQEFPWITFSDLWTLAGCVAINNMGGVMPPAGLLCGPPMLCCVPLPPVKSRQLTYMP
jgi:hypothetical protein